MSDEVSIDDLPKVESEKNYYVLSGKTLNTITSLLGMLWQGANVKGSGNIEVHQSPGAGWSIFGTGGSTSSSVAVPLQAVDYSNNSGAAVRIRWGTINNIVPTIGGAPITVDINDDDNAPLYLTEDDTIIVIDIDVTTAGAVDSVSIFSQSSSTPPANEYNDDGSATCYLTLAGIVVHAPTDDGDSWYVTIADNLTGSQAFQLCGTSALYGVI
jgi:hypothetical protein